MQKVLFTPARFLVAVLGMAVVGAVLQAAKPQIFSLVAAVIILISIFAVFRPIAIGWLRYRAVSAGLLVGALMLLSFMPAPNNIDPANEASKPNSAQKASSRSQAQSLGRKTLKNRSDPGPETDKSRPRPVQDRNKQLAWVDTTKDAVRQRLKDPQSARFRNVFFHAHKGKTPVVCGEVNGKNSFGGYSGYQHFIASGEALVYIESDFKSGEFAKAWSQPCRR